MLLVSFLPITASWADNDIAKKLIREKKNQEHIIQTEFLPLTNKEKLIVVQDIILTFQNSTFGHGYAVQLMDLLATHDTTGSTGLLYLAQFENFGWDKPQAQDALVRRGQSEIPILLNGLKQTVPKIRYAAIIILGRIAQTEATARPHIYQAMHHQDPFVRMGALAAATYFDDKPAHLIKEIEKLFLSPEKNLRQAIMVRLGDIPYPNDRALNLLEKGLKDDAYFVRLEAVYSLGKVGIHADKKSRSLKKVVFNKEKNNVPGSLALNSLFKITTDKKTLIPTLITALDDPNLNEASFKLLYDLGPDVRQHAPKLTEFLAPGSQLDSQSWARITLIKSGFPYGLEKGDLWTMQNGEKQKQWNAPDQKVPWLVISPDEKWLAYFEYPKEEFRPENGMLKIHDLSHHRSHDAIAIPYPFPHYPIYWTKRNDLIFHTKHEGQKMSHQVYSVRNKTLSKKKKGSNLDR
ncbi:hypothetical protein BVX98_05250 [bacterium F11]|nr:hypothetical protein BVX98_05250 [bacterium F11]